MAESGVKPSSGRAIRSKRVVEKRAQLQERLLRVGGHLVAERGLAAVSVEDILEGVKVSRRTFYGYFANKYELIAGIMNPALLDGAEMLTETVRESPDLLLPGLVDCYLSLWRLHRDALSVIAVLEPEVLPYIESGHRKFGAALKKVLTLASKSGKLRNDDPQYTFKVITRTAVPLLKVYADHPDGERLYREAMLALLGKSA